MSIEKVFEYKCGNVWKCSEGYRTDLLLYGDSRSELVQDLEDAKRVVRVCVDIELMNRRAADDPVIEMAYKDPAKLTVYQRCRQKAYEDSFRKRYDPDYKS